MGGRVQISHLGGQISPRLVVAGILRTTRNTGKSPAISIEGRLKAWGKRSSRYMWAFGAREQPVARAARAAEGQGTLTLIDGEICREVAAGGPRSVPSVPIGGTKYR